MGKDKNKQSLKNPKGTRDWYGEDVDLLDDILAQIQRVFRKHAAKKLDTPVFELQEVLKGKYGEDSKLIYDVADQGGELLSLRYDLTVPFARWLAMNPNIDTYKRFAVAKVYRRDQPAVAKGRMREFWQCDVDFAGPSDAMAMDSEVIGIIVKVFEGLEWKGQYTIKINDRRILDGLFEVCGVPQDKIRAISSAVDKLDKMPWSEVRREMVETKGLDGDTADRIEKYVTMKGGKGDSQSAVELLEILKNDEKLMANAKAKDGVTQFEKLLGYLRSWNALDKISFDLSLARGLDYYTGVIYEIITEGSRPPTLTNGDKAQEDKKKTQKKAKKEGDDDDEDRSDDPTVGVGSVAAGGRYDNLVGRFREKAEVPCVGVSFGVDRILSITKKRLEQGQKFSYISSKATDVYVMAFGGKDFDGALRERMEIANKLVDAGFTAEFTYKEKPKLPAQFKKAEQAGAPIGIILGQDEMKEGKAKIKIMGLPDSDPRKEGVLIDQKDLVIEVRKALAEAAAESQKKTLAVAAAPGMNGPRKTTIEQLEAALEKLRMGEVADIGGTQYTV